MSHSSESVIPGHYYIFLQRPIMKDGHSKSSVFSHRDHRIWIWYGEGLLYIQSVYSLNPSVDNSFCSAKQFTVWIVYKGRLLPPKCRHNHPRQRSILVKMKELPDEIWLLIAEYLPDHQVRRLYSVNKALFHIALDLRHRNAFLGILPDRVVDETKPPIVGNRLLSSRPTGLQIAFYDSLDHYAPNVMQTKSRSSSSLKQFFRTIIDKAMGRKKSEPVLPTPKLAQLTEHAMPQLTSITRFSFSSKKRLDGVDDAEPSLFFSEVLRIVGHRLRSLHIQSPFAIYLPPRLELLEAFSVDAFKPYHTVEIHNTMIHKVPAFLLAHKSTVCNVSFAMDDHFDVSPIFQCLELMSHLHSIHLSLPYGAMATSTVPLGDILKTHQQHMKSLSLTFVPPTLPVFLYEDWCSVGLPKLRNLTICLPGMFGNELGTYIRQFSSSLVSVEINHSFDTRDKLQAFCTVLSDFPHLQNLSLSIFDFHPGDLFLFATTLPRLHSLFVDYSSVYLRMGEDFTQEYSPLLSKWALESFDYKTRYSRYDDWIAREVAIRLPKVVWVHKRPRDECLWGGYDANESGPDPHCPWT